jgi:hypothetical protein
MDTSQTATITADSRYRLRSQAESAVESYSVIYVSLLETFTHQIGWIETCMLL